jgi:hypothetical protein
VTTADASGSRVARLTLDRDQILSHRRSVSDLDVRLPAGPASLERAAFPGLQDSMPRAALLSLHARVEGVLPNSWDDPILAQVWGPRFSAYVIAARDQAVFTLGRHPDEPGRVQRATEMADRLEALLGERRMSYAEAGHALGVNPNALRYGTTTGRIRIRWEGARRPLVWTIPPPEMSLRDARLELARRHLRVLGPATSGSFGDWAGIRPGRAAAIYRDLAPELVPIATPIGDAWILAADEASFRQGGAEAARTPAAARLLPSGDTFFLLQGRERELLVTDPRRRPELWTSRVWPGAVLVNGEVEGVWRRAGATVDVDAWRDFTAAEREAVEAEAASFPLPDVEGAIRVRWSR